MQSDYESPIIIIIAHHKCIVWVHVIPLQVYTLGTILSMQISFVGFQPVQSSEHMAVSIVFVLWFTAHY